jgi:hypothetical protein
MQVNEQSQQRSKNRGKQNGYFEIAKVRPPTIQKFDFQPSIIKPNIKIVLHFLKNKIF